MKAKPKHRARWIIISALAAGVLIWVFRPAPLRVELAVAARGPLMVTIDHDGRTRVKNRFIVSAPLAGRLQRIALKPGDPVEAGRTIIAAIDPGEPDLLNPRALAEAGARVKAAEAALQQSTAQRERAHTLLELAKGDLDRMSRTAVSGAVSAGDLDAAEHKAQAAGEDLRAAEFACQVAAFDLEQAKAALVFARPSDAGTAGAPGFVIRAPINGRVFRVFQESATVVAPGARVMELADPADLEIEIDVLSTSAAQITPGMKVLVEHWGGPHPLEARVRMIEPSAFTKVSSLGIEEQRVNVIADLVSPPEKHLALGDAYRIEARVVVWESREVLKLPAGALFREAEEWAVFALVDGRAKLRRVTIGHRNDFEAEVVDGVAAGDHVVVYPSDRVEEGVRLANGE